MARCVLRVLGIRLAAKGWCGPGGRGCAPCGHVPASRAAASLVERSASGGLASGRRPVPQDQAMASAARSALGAKGGSTHGALRLAGIGDTPSGQGLVRAWWPWLCPLWARSGLQGCSIPCGAIRKWWPGEWPQASPAGTKPDRRAQKGIPFFANAKMRRIEMPINRHSSTEFHSITDDTE